MYHAPKNRMGERRFICWDSFVLVIHSKRWEEHQQETKAGLKFEQINDFPDVDLLSEGIQGYFQPCYWQAFKRNGKTCSLGL